MEGTLAGALRAEGWKVVRAHAFDKAKKHGFIDSQKMGMEVFRSIDPQAPLIVAESRLAVQSSCAPRALHASRARF